MPNNIENRSGVTPELLTALEALHLYINGLAESTKIQAEKGVHIKNINAELSEIKASLNVLSAYFKESKGFISDLTIYQDELIDKIKEQNKKTVLLLGSIITFLTTVFGFIIWLITSSPIAELRLILQEIIQQNAK